MYMTHVLSLFRHLTLINDGLKATHQLEAIGCFGTSNVFQICPQKVLVVINN